MKSGFLLGAAILLATLPLLGSELEMLAREPISLDDPFLLTNGYLTPPLRSAALLPKGAWQTGLRMSVANSFAKSTWLSHMIEEGQWSGGSVAELEPERPLFIIDGELQRAALSIRHGLTDRIEIGVDVPWLSVDGGGSDRMIERFHEALRIGDDGRPLFPRDRGYLYIRGRNGILERNLEQIEGLGDVAAHVTWQIPSSDDRTKFALTGSVEIPTGNQDHLLGSGSLDFAGQLTGSTMWGETLLNGSVGVVQIGTAGAVREVANTRVVGTLGGSRFIGRSTSAFLVAGVVETPFEHSEFPELEREAMYVIAGLQVHLTSADVMQLAIVENVGSFENSADVALQIAVTRTWGP